MRPKDDYVIVLDFLPHGKAGDRRAEPVAQVLGETFFNLLDVAIKEDVDVKSKDRIYVGGEKREQVKYIRGRIGYEDLTSFAKSLLEEVVEEMINKNEKMFVDFFNKASPITTRLHSLELLPGIGKKHLWAILTARKKEPFQSFKNLQERVGMLPNPKKMIVKRIISELEGKDRHRLFVAGGV